MKKEAKILFASMLVLAVFLVLAFSIVKYNNRSSSLTASSIESQGRDSSSIFELNREIENAVSRSSSLGSVENKLNYLLQRRKLLLLEYLKISPRHIYELGLDSSTLEKLRLASFKNIEGIISSISGDLGIVHYDDFDNPENSTFEYYISTREGTKYGLYPINEEGLVPNIKIEVKDGLQLDSYIFGEVSRLSVKIEAVPNIIAYNTGTNIKWQVQNATSCSGSGGSIGWAGPKSIAGGSFQTGKLTQNQTYIITCQNSFDTVTSSATVTVVANVASYIQNDLVSYTPPIAEPVPYKIGVFLINPNLDWQIPFSIEDVKKEVFDGQFQEFIKEASYGKRYVAGDVYGWIQLNQETPNCTYGGGVNMNNSGISDYIIQNNVQIDLYNYILIVRHCTNNNGVAQMRSFEINGTTYTLPAALINIKADGLTAPWVATGGLVQPFPWTIFDRLLSHELGHIFGLWDHANGWDCNNESVGEHCQKINYGNAFDSMGERGYSTHYNGSYKKVLGWLSQKQILNITQSGRYTINPLETDTGIKLAEISNPASISKKYYTVEYRKAIGFDSILNNPTLAENQNGIFINKKSKAGLESLLIDLKPTEQSWYLDIQDAILPANSPDVFSDADLGITISKVSKGPNSISFNVDISPDLPLCIHNPVEITTYSPYYTYSILDHNDYAYENFIILKNKDSEVGCTASSYKKVITPTDNVLTPDEVSEYNNDTYIEPGQTKSLPIYSDLINPHTVPGSYTYNINVKNVTFPDAPEANATFILNVVP